ncbi:hypothetical protein [Nocardioides perillae]|uniref:Uncharacterized protein n=1 Tax=Nocardioides perillae TaxID=1119534 RepID=A0A7Y9RS59_9ACTN|nr:hypothetical protein [Nocardioides perillae]NYG53973.1 hypothetical protein [Nocardioides perillae]
MTHPLWPDPPPPAWYDEPWPPPEPAPPWHAGGWPHRSDADGELDDAVVRHLVFLGGRLVETWSEPAEETRWASTARRLAVERDRRALPPPPPPPPLWAQVQTWLAVRVGGRAALDRLDDRALTAGPDGTDALDHDDLLLPTTDGEARERLELVADLLGHVAEMHFDAEVGVAMRRALVRTHAEDASVVGDARSATHLAGGIAWAVTRANGLLGTQRAGAVAQVPARRLQESLALRSSPAELGRRTQRALLGFRSHGDDRPPRGSGAPDLLALGDPLLLTGATRARLLRLRDRAREAELAEAGEPGRPGAAAGGGVDEGGRQTPR